MRIGNTFKLPLLKARQTAILWLLLSLLSIPARSQQFINPRFSQFTINNGLSQNLVYSITQDKTGFMWFGTKDGLNRFDGYEFKTFHHDPFDSNSIAGSSISALLSDSRGRLWVGTMNGNLDLYDNRKNCFKHFLKGNTNQGNIVSITEDLSGNIWVGTYGNGVFQLIFENDNLSGIPKRVFHYLHNPDDSASINDNFILDVFADKKGGLWISTINGFFQYGKIGTEKIHFATPEFPIYTPGKQLIPGGAKFSLDESVVRPWGSLKSISGRYAEDEKHRIWFGTGSGIFLVDREKGRLVYFDALMPGLAGGNIRSITRVSFMKEGKLVNALLVGFLSGAGIFDTENYTLQLILHDPADSKSLLSGSMLSVYQDRSGCLWLGSSGMGLSKFDTRATLFPMPEYHTADGKIRTESLSARSFLDTRKYLFIGTQSLLMMADKSTHLMKPVFIDGNRNGSYMFYHIAAGDSESCWIASNYGLTYFDYEKNIVKNYSTGIQQDNRIYKLFKDKIGNIWCLTPYSLSAFNINQKAFTHYFFDNRTVNPFSESTYGDIYQTPEGNFWLGTGNGLLYFDSTSKKFTRYTTKSSDPTSLSFDAVSCVLPDPKYPQKYLWISTTGGGLNKMDLHTKKFTHYTEKNGLPNNVVYGILADEKGNLWMSTNKGISRFDPSSQTFTNYDAKSGLQSNEFNSGAFYKSRDGKLYFGGISGFNAFIPANIGSKDYIPPLAFTGFNLFNKPVTVNNKNSPLTNAIGETKKIVLPYSDNLISFQVAALDFSNPEKQLYAYKLEPSDKSWIQMGNNRLITFSNLAPGNYILRVKAGSMDGAWNEKGISLSLIILPPWWRTWWAYLIYSLLAIAVLYFFRRYELKRLKLRNRLQVEHVESQKLKELDHLKSRFFANISHEFRTPLTLIMGPVEDLLKTGNADQFKKILPEVHRNSRRLLELINQLLDLSKLDARRYRINTSREDILPYAEQIVHNFYSLAERKNIDLQLNVSAELREKIEQGDTKFYFDEDMIEKILNNLLSNAFKFTGEQGTITVSLKTAVRRSDFLELSVSDTGIGIPKEKLSHVFHRFYQADDSDERHYEGSGVGLSLLKELVDLLHGEVTVESEPGKGTTFYCYLPFNNQIFTEKTSDIVRVTQPVSPSVTYEAPETETHIGRDKSGDIVLIVEDHPDVRRYIRGKLENCYSILEASNGTEGLQMAQGLIPDLVISDVMMPGMDGFELCEKLKTDNLTSHIPVILLTAKAEESDKMTGLEHGADAYLVKPFNSHELNIRVRKLIELRKKLRAKFSDKLVVKPSEITVTSMDQIFMEKLMSSVESHINDVGFSVTRLASEMNMSVSQLSRKLKVIIDQSPQKFIRSIRMQRALILLRENAATVSEVSWEVGFEEPSYFSRVFKTYFGCLPSEKEKFPEQRE